MAQLVVSHYVSIVRARFTYTALALATIAVGLAVHLYGSALGPDSRDVLGDIIWAAMIVWWVSAIAPRRSLLSRALIALAICFVVELSQLMHTPGLDMLRGTTIGQLTLGSGFDQRDLVAYSVGVLAAAFLERGWFNWRDRSASRRYQMEMSARLPTKQVAASSDPANWILQRLHRFGLDVGSFVPDGFEAYARINHPPIEGGPRAGTLNREIADRLVQTLADHTQSAAKCWFALWEGWGDIDGRWPTAPRVLVPHREMLLFEGPIGDALTTFSSVDWHYQSANLWWPDDRAWCVATEVDAEWTYVGGSKECIAQLLADPKLEAYPVTPTTAR